MGIGGVAAADSGVCLPDRTDHLRSSMARNTEEEEEEINKQWEVIALEHLTSHTLNRQAHNKQET